MRRKETSVLVRNKYLALYDLFKIWRRKRVKVKIYLTFSLTKPEEESVKPTNTREVYHFI